MNDDTALAGQTWVLTGAAGAIGSSLRSGLASRVRELRLLDVAALTPADPAETAVVADIRDQAAVQRACEGADGIVHLAGIPDEADFHDLAAVNIVGTYHVLEAARLTGARRVVLASTNHVTGFYPAGTAVDPRMPPRPDSLYAVSKVADEALGRMYADKFGLAVAAIRIASFGAAPQDARHQSTWLSEPDCLAAVLAAMTAPDLTYAVFYGVSRNTRRWWDLAAGEALGYHPVDNAEDHRGAAAGADPFTGPQGGHFADADYTAGRQRTPP